MIDGQLVKKLKEANFPFTPSKLGKTAFVVPTLSELIEACGMGTTLQVTSTSGTTHAHIFGFGDKYKVIGSTPLEAVANLWLELNKK